VLRREPDGLVEHDRDGRRLGDQLVDGDAQDVAVDDRHALEAPAPREAADACVDPAGATLRAR
jgi:hypothetical protein